MSSVSRLRPAIYLRSSVTREPYRTPRQRRWSKRRGSERLSSENRSREATVRRGPGRVEPVPLYLGVPEVRDHALAATGRHAPARGGHRRDAVDRQLFRETGGTDPRRTGYPRVG